MKEMQANDLALKLRLTTPQAIISESTGGDFEEVIDQLADEEEYMEGKGIIPNPEIPPAVPEKDEKKD